MTSPVRFLAPPMADNKQLLLADDTVKTATLTHRGVIRLTGVATGGSTTGVTIGFGRSGDTPGTVYVWLLTQPPPVFEVNNESVEEIYYQAYPPTPGNTAGIYITPG